MRSQNDQEGTHRHHHATHRDAPRDLPTDERDRSVRREEDGRVATPLLWLPSVSMWLTGRIPHKEGEK